MGIKLIAKSKESFGGTFTESIHLSASKLSVKVQSITGKDGDFWISVCPSLNVSGYGDTKELAEESLDHNMNIFAEDLTDLKMSQRILELKKLGWNQANFFKKRLSKAFVDEDGVLQNLEHAELRSLESVA
jgi:hypothetical protein